MTSALTILAAMTAGLIDHDLGGSDVPHSLAGPAARRLVVYTADNCRPCQAWKRRELPRLKAAGVQMQRVTLLDQPKHNQEFQKHGFRYIPAFVIYDGSDVVKRYQGYQRAETLVVNLQEVKQ